MATHYSTVEEFISAINELTLEPATQHGVAVDAFIAERDALADLIGMLWGGALRRLAGEHADPVLFSDLESILFATGCSYARDAIVTPIAEWGRVAGARAACYGGLVAHVRRLRAVGDGLAHYPALASPVSLIGNVVRIELVPAEDFLASLFSLEGRARA
jgi:hypothetical protein